MAHLLNSRPHTEQTPDSKQHCRRKMCLSHLCWPVSPSSMSPWGCEDPNYQRPTSSCWAWTTRGNRPSSTSWSTTWVWTPCPPSASTWKCSRRGRTARTSTWPCGTSAARRQCGSTGGVSTRTRRRWCSSWTARTRVAWRRRAGSWRTPWGASSCGADRSSSWPTSRTWTERWTSRSSRKGSTWGRLRVGTGLCSPARRRLESEWTRPSGGWSKWSNSRQTPRQWKTTSRTECTTWKRVADTEFYLYEMRILNVINLKLL